MTKKQKALWLQEHYKKYSLKWYLENESRLNAIFRKVYNRYMSDLNARASKAQLSHIEDLGKRMREVYENVYGTKFDSDCRLDRAETNRKVQAIRSMWVVAPAQEEVVMDRISILLETLPRESTISILYESSVAVVVARDNQERLLFKVTTTVAVAMQLQAEWLVV